jgi:beta-lactamase family protein
MSSNDPDDESASDSEQESEQQSAESEQVADRVEAQSSDSDLATTQSEVDTVAEGSQKTDNTGTESDDSSDNIEQPADESGSTQVAMADTDGGVSMDAGGGGGDDIVVSGSPFGGPYDPGFVSAETAFANCLKVPDSLTLSLVDVTDPAAPVFAGIRADDTVFIASMAKIAALYAAFELRKRLQDAIAGVPVTTSVSALIAQVKKTWQPLIDAQKPKNAAAFAGFPNLTDIFDITLSGSSWSVTFTTKGDINTLADKEGAGWPSLNGKFGFKELLFLMASFSNNDAAARCITSLSYEYINAALVVSGLYENGKGGLWLGAPYPHKPGAALTETLWMQEPINKDPNTTRRYQVSSAKAAATMFTLLAQRKLVDATSSDEMLDFLQAGTNDFVQNALADASRDVNSIRTKIGVIDKVYWSQTSLVERNLIDHGKPIRYVISILNNRAPFSLTKATIEPLDQCILNRHPGAVPP